MPAPPAPPLVVMARLVWLDGTVILKYCQLLNAPERLVTGTPLVSVVTPPPPLVVTTRLTVVECVLPPPVPVTVIGYVPAGVDADAVRVISEVPDPGAAIDDGLKPAVAPEGRPVAVSTTEELKPPETAVVMVELPDEP